MADKIRNRFKGGNHRPVKKKKAKSNFPKFLPYGRQHVTENDIAAVRDVLKSDWLTQGPNIITFEKKLAELTGAKFAVVCSSGTAALHLAMLALGLGHGDEIVTSPVTFLASANCARYVGAEVRFADVNAATGLISIKALEQVLHSDKKKKIKVIVPVHLGGQPAAMGEIQELAEAHGAMVVDDACHALGARYRYRGREYRIGGSPHAVITAFSFHPVKHVAMGEGGALTTDSNEIAEKLRRFRSHGIQKDAFINDGMAFSSEKTPNPWYYEMQELGYNYRLTDIQAALGVSQLKRLNYSLKKRHDLAERYCRLLKERFPDGGVRPLQAVSGVYNAFHLFIVLIDFIKFGLNRAEVMNRLRSAGIGTQVHYIPVYLQPYYRRRYGYNPGAFPEADSYYEKALSLPMYPQLTFRDCQRVIDTLKKILENSH